MADISQANYAELIYTEVQVREAFCTDGRSVENSVNRLAFGKRPRPPAPRRRGPNPGYHTYQPVQELITTPITVSTRAPQLTKQAVTVASPIPGGLLVGISAQRTIGATLSMVGIPRQPNNVFGMLCRCVFRNPDNAAIKTTETLYPVHSFAQTYQPPGLGAISGSADFWVQKGAPQTGGIPAYDVTIGPGDFSTRFTAQEGDIVVPDSNWWWPIPSNPSIGSQGETYVAFGSPQDESSILESIEFLILMQVVDHINPTEELEPQYPGPFVLGPDPATQMRLDLYYMTTATESHPNGFLVRKGTKTEAYGLMELADLYHVEANIRGWDFPSSQTARAIRGRLARWESVKFLLDSPDGESGIIQVSTPSDTPHVATGTILGKTMTMAGFGVMQERCRSAVEILTIQEGREDVTVGGIREAQKVNLVNVNGGSYRLTVEAGGLTATTGFIAWDATPEVLAGHLMALPMFDRPGDVEVRDSTDNSGPNVSRSYIVTFAYRFGNVPAMEVDSNLLCDYIVPVNPPPYPYALPECNDEEPLCSPGPLTCKPGEGEPDVTNPACCDPVTIRDSANVTRRVEFQRELFDPAEKDYTVRDLAVSKGLRPSLYNAYVRNFATGVLSDVAMSDPVECKMSVVLINKDIDTKSTRARIAQQLTRRPNILPSRMHWTNPALGG